VLEKTAQGCDAPGAVLLADTPQGRFLSAYGLASTQDQTPLQTTDAFQIGSNTKSFTTVLALLLQEDGIWSLDDPLSKWLPEQAAKIQDGDQITLRMMGQNHTGIPDYADAVIGDALKADILDQASLEKGYTPEQLVDIGVNLREPSFAPGEGWEYSTTNFILLGMAIEKATGKPLEQLYQERIFEPLGMQDSYLLNDVPEKGSFVNGYYTLTGGTAADVTNWNGSQGWAGGSIVSTAEDMAKYAKGLSDGSVFKDPSSLEQMTAFGDGPIAPFSGYGLGVGIWSQDLFGWGHAGQTPGFQSLFAIYPEKTTQVIFFANSGSCNVYSLPQTVSASPDLFTQ
jgi:D-alanyl-D-alanine carboxypeptidase